MNPHCSHFSPSEITALADNQPRLYPIKQLAVLTVSGTEAAQFLQGQITCNVQDVSDTQSCLGAFCNPKGRVISTFLLVKANADFLVLLPSELLPSMKQRLQKYILRSKVTLIDSSEQLCVFGADGQDGDFLATRVQDDVVRIQWRNRYLFIGDAHKADALWCNYKQQGFQVSDAAQWRYLEITACIAWLTLDTSEQFIPQMLNLDKLGGISLNKGCYTGQEIVARTHYLGKAKRALFLAHCAITPDSNAEVIDDSGQTIGTVLMAEANKLLLVLHIDSDTARLRLKDYNHASVTLLTESL